MATKNLKITVKVPHGIKSTDAIVKEATKAAQEVINKSGELLALQKELAAKGLNFTIEELEAHRAKGKPAAKRKTTRKATAKKATKRKGKRKALTDADRKSIIEELKKGGTASATATKFGFSTATVNNIKRDAGLTKKRG